MENAEKEEFAQPNVKEVLEAAERPGTTPETMPNENSGQVIPIKFNKEIKEITLEEAKSLAQKGMKYDTVSEPLERIRSLAADSGKTLAEYVSFLEKQQKSAQNESQTEKKDTPAAESELIKGINELLANAPEIKSIEDIPQSVLKAAKEKGGNLFDEYLRYQFEQSRKVRDALLSRENAERSAVGPISTGTPVESALSAEFLKGLFK